MINIEFSPTQNYSLRSNAKQQAGFGAKIEIYPYAAAKLAELLSPQQLQELNQIQAEFCALPSTATLYVNGGTKIGGNLSAFRWHGHLEDNGKTIGEAIKPSIFTRSLDAFQQIKSLIEEARKKLT